MKKLKPRFITSHPGVVVVGAARARELVAYAPTREALCCMISISDPDDDDRPDRKSRGLLPTYELNFDDIERPKKDHIPPNEGHVRDILGADRARRMQSGRILIHCAAGRSRSTAAALIVLCDRLGPGREAEAMAALLTACERAPLPNMWFCQLADEHLGRGGALVRVAQQQNDSPEDAEADGNKPVTGTALLAAVRRGDL